ncbi:MAG TPA: 3-oxoacid CoA-transferase subunit B, partial [Ilumatobacteraceae bacterium]
MTAHLTVEQLAREVGLALDDGWYVNLGIGMPSLVADFVPPDREVLIHCENGMLGMGPPAAPGTEDPNLVDAGKRAVTLVPGGAYMSHADSFALIRGRHLDACVLGAYEVAANGDLANWSLGDNVPAVGGAMDLAVGAKRVFVMTQHCSKDGRPKLLATTTLPLTAAGVVTRVFTDLGVFAPAGDRFDVLGLVDGVDLDAVAARTGAPLAPSPDMVRLSTLDERGER